MKFFEADFEKYDYVESELQWHETYWFILTYFDKFVPVFASMANGHYAYWF